MNEVYINLFLSSIMDTIAANLLHVFEIWNGKKSFPYVLSNFSPTIAKFNMHQD